MLSVVLRSVVLDCGGALSALCTVVCCFAARCVELPRPNAVVCS